MIFVTTGAQKVGFVRLLEYIENSNIEDEIIVQAAATDFKSKKNMIIKDFFSYDEMKDLRQKADIIITHAGTGSVTDALALDKKVIVCPRLKKYNEAVDDHQLQLAEVFGKEGYVLVMNDGDDFDKVFKNVKTFKPKKFKSNTKKFISELKKII